MTSMDTVAKKQEEERKENARQKEEARADKWVMIEETWTK
jgi:hypothetical protein